MTQNWQRPGEYAEENKADEADKESEGPNSPPQPSQNNKTNSEDELEEMLNELENGTGIVEYTNDPKTDKKYEIPEEEETYNTIN